MVLGYFQRAMCFPGEVGWQARLGRGLQDCNNPHAERLGACFTCNPPDLGNYDQVAQSALSPLSSKDYSL